MCAFFSTPRLTAAHGKSSRNWIQSIPDPSSLPYIMLCVGSHGGAVGETRDLGRPWRSKGIAGAVLERGWPSAADPVALTSFLVDNRTAIIAQSACFLLSWAIYFRFLASLRSILLAAGKGTGTLTHTAFRAGIAWIYIRGFPSLAVLTIRRRSGTASVELGDPA